LHRALTVAVAASVPAVALTGAIWLIAAPWFLRWEYGRAGFPAAEGFTEPERLAAAIPSTLYLTRPSVSTADLAALEHDGRPLYEPGEISHLEDVRRLVRAIGAGGAAGAFVILGALAAALKDPRWRQPFGTGLLFGGAGTIGAVALAGAAVAVSWSWFFVAFHEVLFPPGTWQFSMSSGLIRLFPERFWFDSAIALVSCVALTSAGAMTCGAWIRRAAARSG
jgi:uncharacterized membrane protein